MPHAVLVRRPGNYRDPNPRPLAVDLPGLAAARRLAMRLAKSYPLHGCHETGVFWFRDRDGLVEIWPEAQ